MSEAPSLRETLESAIAADAAEAEPVVAPVVEAAPESAAQPEPQETAAEAAQRARDEKGRFAPKAPEAKPEPAAAKPTEQRVPKGADDGGTLPEKPAAKQEAAVRDPQLAGTDKAPASWKPLAREKWSALPPEVREEWSRREKEMAGFVARNGEHVKVVEQMRQTLQPYEAIARANGMDAMQYAGSVMQTAAVLHMGSQQQKDALIARLIGMYGASVDGINAHLQGQAPQAHAAPQQAPQDVSALVQQEFQRVAQEAQQQRAASAWEEFQATEPEFLEQVKPAMREILHLAGQQNRNMTYQQAYDRACKLDEEVSAVLDQRKSAAAARAQAPTVQRAKVAGSSIKATPAATAIRPAGPRSLREEIEAAVAAQRT
jgi:hypothetical protein